jgi:outer membrane lipoprotein-sorting protein
MSPPFFRISILSILVLAGLLVSSFSRSKQDNPNKATEILRKTFEANRTVKSIRVTMLMQERVDNELIRKKSDFKVIFNPYQMYVKQYYPNEGLEVLYSGKTEGKAYINRNTSVLSFMKLDPLGNTIRKGNHHSLFKAGFDFLVGVLEQLHDEYENKGNEVWKYEGLVKYADIISHKIVFQSPDFRFIDYRVKEGENLEDISNKLKINDFMIFENNPQLKSFDEVAAGSVIKIPSDYGKQIVVYIARDTNLPVGMKVFDEKGLFEDYTYTHTEVNPEFTRLDFDDSNPAYGFR